MGLYKVNPSIVFDHEQAAFMFYGGEWDGVKMVPSHYISKVEVDGEYIRVICDTKYHKETFQVYSSKAEEDVEKVVYLLEEFS